MDNEYQLTPEERVAVDEMLAEAETLKTEAVARQAHATGALKMLAKLKGLSGNLKYDEGILRGTAA